MLLQKKKARVFLSRRHHNDSVTCWTSSKTEILDYCFMISRKWSVSVCRTYRSHEIIASDNRKVQCFLKSILIVSLSCFTLRRMRQEVWHMHQGWEASVSPELDWICLIYLSIFLSICRHCLNPVKRTVGQFLWLFRLFFFSFLLL